MLYLSEREYSTKRGSASKALLPRSSKIRSTILSQGYVDRLNSYVHEDKRLTLYVVVEPADFFPWTGDNPEDNLGEQSIKSGYFDKASASQNELNSARPAIWSNVKHKSGLQVLSSLYISALDQRQDCSTVTPRSTFKPPPRATLTEAKREIWLRDLADPNVPLRRLSRTIPHGIRGKVLLDQALAKQIPLWRTVWLAKCVGANEIRAFKRKGTAGVFASGGEAKWIRDWTINNEQFLEGLIGACGTEGWKDSLLYGYVLKMRCLILYFKLGR